MLALTAFAGQVPVDSRRHLVGAARQQIANHERECVIASVLPFAETIYAFYDIQTA